jgi:hypothetical protein
MMPVTNDTNAMAKESESFQLVRSLEQFRGCEMKTANRRMGFNGVSICDGSIIRKVEVKTVVNSDNWFAINGLYGIESLFFDPQYYLYFVLSKERIIVIAQAMPFLQMQIPKYNSEVGDEVRQWTALTRQLCDISGLNVLPRINFKLKVGIRNLLKLLADKAESVQWQQSIDSVWQSEDGLNWTKTFPL